MQPTNRALSRVLDGLHTPGIGDDLLGEGTRQGAIGVELPGEWAWATSLSLQASSGDGPPASVYTLAADRIVTLVRFRSEPAFSHAPHGGAHTLGRRRPWVRSSRECGFDHFDSLIADAGHRTEEGAQLGAMGRRPTSTPGAPIEASHGSTEPMARPRGTRAGADDPAWTPPALNRGMLCVAMGRRSRHRSRTTADALPLLKEHGPNRGEDIALARTGHVNSTAPTTEEGQQMQGRSFDDRRLAGRVMGGAARTTATTGGSSSNASAQQV